MELSLNIIETICFMKIEQKDHLSYYSQTKMVTKEINPVYYLEE